MLLHLWLCVLVFRLSSAEHVSSIQCSIPRSKICIIQDVGFVDSTVPQFPNLDDKHTLHIRGGNMSSFGKDFPLGRVRKLTLGRLGIRSLWVKHTLAHLTAEGNHIQEVFMEGTEKYQMQYLNLKNNQLRSIRELKHLTNLEELWLDGNQLEFLEMDNFVGMQQLKKLSLAGNKIEQITTSSNIELPALEMFSLESNHLTKLNVKNWTMLQLTELRLGRNQLVKLDVDNFDHFVSLEGLALADNAWYCNWLRKALADIGRKFITLLDRDEDCPAMPVEEICCTTALAEDEPIFADLVKRIRTVGESQNRSRVELSQRINRFNESWHGDWVDLDREVKRQERMIDEINGQLKDDNRITADDVKELEKAVKEMESGLDELRELASEHAQFEHEFSRLFYIVIDSKNMFLNEMRKAASIEKEMKLYKDVFDSNM
ncbi:uncharacterized protein LOC129769825 [Toxorhynchites rutilus septentrionalis]|uniref:uncharacterized protein LOC129769825 n=1 Tax=Toxorhynchites rutilus septentrionalis TaxID=329112 RepID=UPI002478EC73|nr:uncharacterized protein LOC129769825 [Toxorhynchites rutilus septentrionalis]